MAVKTLESCIFGKEHAKMLVRFARKPEIVKPYPLNSSLMTHESGVITTRGWGGSHGGEDEPAVADVGLLLEPD